MSSTVKFAMYTGIFLLVGAVIYFFAFWRPNSSRAEQLTLDIEAARAELTVAAQRDEIHPQLRSDVDRMREELNQEQSTWEHVSHQWIYNYARFLPDVFDDGDIWYRIHRIVSPHSEVLTIEFDYSEGLGAMRYNDSNPNGPPEGIWLTPVSVGFITSYEGLIAILNDFAHEGIDNRVIEYTLNRQYDRWNVQLRLDILTQTPPPHRYNGDYTVYSHED